MSNEDALALQAASAAVHADYPPGCEAVLIVELEGPREVVAAEAVGAHKTSMLQDVEAGRPIELEAIVGAVRELGERLGLQTPSIDAIFGLTRLFGQVRGLLPAPAGPRPAG